MKSGKDNGRNLPRKFQRLLQQLARQARRDLEAIPRHPRRSIHALRIRMKKLAAIVRIVRHRMPEGTRRAILAASKRLRKAFTAQRDAQTVADLGFGRGRKAPPRMDETPLFEEAAALEALLAETKLDGLQLDDVRDAYVHTYRIGRKRMKHCRDIPKAKELHEWRRPVKELFYQSLAMRRAHGMKKRIRRARKLARWLGRDHDWEVVIQQDPQARKRLESKRSRLRKRIFALGEKLYSIAPKKLERKLD